MRPKRGDRITAAWAGGIQSRAEMPLSPGMQKTSGGYVLAQRPASQSVTEIAKGLTTAIPPFSIMFLKPAAVERECDITYEVVTNVITPWCATNGAAEVPANGYFQPIMLGIGDRIKVRTDEDDTDWVVGSTVGRKKDDTYCASSGYGFICLKTPVNDLAIVEYRPRPTWAVAIGSSNSEDPLTANTQWDLRWFRFQSGSLSTLEVSEFYDFYYRRDDGSIVEDGTFIQLDVRDFRLTLVDANCGPTSGLEGLP